MTDIAYCLQNLPKVRGEYKFNEPLKNYTWLNVGGPADVMFFPEDSEDLQYFLQHKSDDLKVFVLGGGANLLVRDFGIRGAVVKLKNKNFCQTELEDGIIVCGAGLPNFVLKKTVAEQGLGGLEFLCSIPGCVGGALRSNAGCFGREMSDVLLWAEVIDGKGNIMKVQKEDFRLGYRHSDFPDDWIVLKTALRYDKKSQSETASLIAEQAEYRKAHQPQGIRTAGSTFKNPPGMRAWELIKNSGADQLKFGGVRMSPQHCNFLENDGTASASDIEKLCNEVITKVEEKFGVRLEAEVKTIGEGC